MVNEMNQINPYQILSYGVIGLGFLLAVLAYRLLSNEQRRDRPRSDILRAANIFMAFSVVLCAIGVGSEWLRKPSDTGSKPPGPTTVADVPCLRRNPVKIISIPGRDYNLAQRVRETLEKRGCPVEGPYPRTDIRESPETNQVRFFYRMNQSDAALVALYLKTQFGVADAVSQYVTGVEPPADENPAIKSAAGFVPNYYSEPAGQLEIWLR